MSMKKKLLPFIKAVPPPPFIKSAQTTEQESTKQTAKRQRQNWSLSIILPITDHTFPIQCETKRWKRGIPPTHPVLFQIDVVSYRFSRDILGAAVRQRKSVVHKIGAKCEQTHLVWLCIVQSNKKESSWRNNAHFPHYDWQNNQNSRHLLLFLCQHANGSWPFI